MKERLVFFFMTFYFHNCYVYIESLLIWKYITLEINTPIKEYLLQPF